MPNTNQNRNTWKCIKCETINTENYCFICGQAKSVTEEHRSCKCGHRNNEDARFCAKCGRKLKQSDPNWKVIICVILAMIAMVLAAKSLCTKEPETQMQSAAEQTINTAAVPETVAEDSWKANVLMKDRAMEVIPLGSFQSSVVCNTVFGSELIRSDICRVVFEDTLRNVPDDCWDVSDAQNRSVLAWTIPAADNLYELYIAAEGGINGKLACEDLFCGYQNVTSIEFNNCFHTEEAEDFSRMFYYCWQLEELNLDGIRTDNATNLSEMFANCFHLTSIDVSGFDTSNVEDTSGMFSNCWELQTVDIMNFDLVPVRDVSYMFYQCPAGDGLQMVLDWFWFRNVDRYENFMDEGVLVNGKPWVTLFEVEEISEERNTSAVEVGDIIVFGSYEQDDLNSNGKEAVQWLVLDTLGDKALLLSRFALDSVPYNDATATVTWENSSIRAWLNQEFLTSAFTDTEQKLIQLTEVDNGKAQGNPKWNTNGGNNTYDSVFLLSYAEIDRYFANQNACVCGPTPYARNMGAEIREVGSQKAATGWWWLRSPGEKSNHAAFVNFDGARYSNMVSNGYLSVRPAVWVDVSSAILQ